MKRAVLALLLAVMIMVTAGCSQGNTMPVDEDYFKTVEAANTYDAVLASEGVFRSVTTNYYSDGSTDDYIVYGDKDLHIVTDAYGTLVIENGEVYGYDNESGYYKDLFPGNFSEFYEAYNNLWNLKIKDDSDN